MILNETFSVIFKHRDFCSMLYNKKICIVCKVMSSLQSRDSLKGERSIILTPSIFVNEFNTCKFKSRLSQCLKITWKVAFNIASYGATFTFWVDKSSSKKPKIVNFDDFLKTWNLRSNSVTRQVIFVRTKIGGKCQNWKKSNATFSNTVLYWPRLINFLFVVVVLLETDD